MPQSVDGEYLLKKFPGKGGWTYAEIPEIAQNKENPFGWVTVSGRIDGFELKKYKLMPMGNGQLFLPVKAEIRKNIQKQAGDVVHVQLSVDESPQEIPDELLECFKLEDSRLLITFTGFSQSEQKAYLDWIYAAKSEEKKADRIVEMMRRLESGLKHHQH